MSVEIGLHFHKDYPSIKDEFVTIKENPENENKEWLYYKDNPVFRLGDGFVSRGCRVMEEFAAYIWTEYKCLVGFDGAICDGAYTTMMEYNYRYDNPTEINIDGRDLWDVLAVEYYGQDTVALLKSSEYNDLIPSIEEYMNENKPYFNKAIGLSIIKRINELENTFDDLSKKIHTVSFSLKELHREYCHFMGYEEPEETKI